MTITNPYILAAIGTGFTFLMTALGAATIFLIRKEMKQGMQSAFLGFAAGVMIAAWNRQRSWECRNGFRQAAALC